MTRTGLTLAALLLIALATGCSNQPQSAAPAAGSQPAAAPAGTPATAPPSGAPADAAQGPAGQPPAGGPAAATTAPASPVAAAPTPPTATVAPEPPKPPRTYTLEAGRALKVRTAGAISTKTVKPGDTFSATLADAIVDGDWAIAADGARVTGVVVDADPGGRVKGVASLVVALQQMELSDGSVVDLATSSYAVEAKTTKKKDAAKIGIGAAAGAGVGALVGGKKGAAVGAVVGGAGGTGVTLATRGDPAVIRAGAVVSFRLKAPVVVTKK